MRFKDEYYIVMVMRQFLYSFLILLMLTPSMACAMPSCAAEKQESTAHLPCAEHHANHEYQGKHTGKVRLLSDCMGVDMQGVDTVSIDKPDLKKYFVAYTLVADIPVGYVTYMDAKEIRGPPADWPDIQASQPPLIIITQRFRI